MKRRKDQHFTDQQVALSDFARALSHPARIAIIGFLQDAGEANCGMIVNALPLAQSTVSQHLKALYDAGLLNSRSCGTQVCYSLNCDSIRSFCHAFQCTLGTVEAPHAPTAAQPITNN